MLDCWIPVRSYFCCRLASVPRCSCDLREPTLVHWCVLPLQVSVSGSQFPDGHHPRGHLSSHRTTVSAQCIHCWHRGLSSSRCTIFPFFVISIVSSGLILWDNQLTGTIPDGISTLTALTYVLLVPCQW
jgi:hypothetical protein